MATQTNRSETETYIERLKNSALFQVSLASKELFHSNFWAWLFETPEGNNVSAAEYVKIFFHDFSGSRIEVEREFMNMDLVIQVTDTSPNEIYVIENKIKSAPRKKQLEEYTEKLAKVQKKSGSEIKACLLTSILEPNFDMPENWASKSLTDIADGLESLANNENDSYRKALIKDYVDFIKSLSAIMELGPRSNANQCYDFHIGNNNKDEEAILSQLSDLRIYDLYLKSGGSMLVKYLSEQLKKEDYRLFIHSESGFNNGKFTGDFYFEDQEKDKFRMGIQIEGYQYRRFAMVGGEEQECRVWYHSKKDAEKLPHSIQHMLDPDPRKGWFVNDPKSVYNCKMRDVFCYYNPIFFYQYKILENVTFENIASYLKEDLSMAFNKMCELGRQPKPKS